MILPKLVRDRSDSAIPVLLAVSVVWLVSTTAVMSAQEKKPANEVKAVAGGQRAASPAHPKYTSTAAFIVHFQPPTIAGGTVAAALEWHRDRFEIYRATQGQLLVSRVVLTAALRNPQVAKLPAVRRKVKSGDPVRWLKSRVCVTFPGNAEIMEASLTADDPEEAATLLRAVVQAYLNEIVNREEDKKRVRLSELDKAVSEQEQDIRTSRESLKKLAAELGTSSSGNLTLKQKLFLEELTVYRQELVRVQGETRKLKAALSAQQALLREIDKIGVDYPELDRMMQTDPIGRELLLELGWKKLDKEYLDRPRDDRYRQALKRLQESYNARKAELVELVRQRRRSLIQAEVRKLESSLATLAEQERTLQALVDAKQREAARFGNTTVDVEMLLSDIKNEELVLSQLVQERGRLRVECRAPAHVWLIEAPCKPETPDR